MIVNAEYVDEDRWDFADNVLRANDAIINGYNWIQALMSYEFGAEPFACKCICNTQ